MKKTIFFLIGLSLPLISGAADQAQLKVSEGPMSLKVRATAPIPSEVTNESQAQALSRDAAITRGQTALLTYVLGKKAHSKKTLAEAEVPSLELQQTIRGYIKGAHPVKTQWTKDECIVVLELSKSQLRSILSKN